MHSKTQRERRQKRGVRVGEEGVVAERDRDREGLMFCVLIVPCQTIIKFNGLAQQNSPFMVAWVSLTVPPELQKKGPLYRE